MLNGRLYSEILEEFQKCETRKERIDLLKKYEHPRFKAFLHLALHPEIIFDVEIPRYRPAPEPAGLNYSYLHNEIDKLYRFIQNHPARPKGLTSDKQKQLLVVILESLYKDEAELLVKLINKDLGIKYLTPILVSEVYPDLNLK